uniref:ARAD1D29392p n=1 Tax=Blastobotrys adeninivorans TaxID=409370 RepID=A0A060THB9_BLAAD
MSTTTRNLKKKGFEAGVATRSSARIREQRSQTDPPPQLSPSAPERASPTSSSAETGTDASITSVRVEDGVVEEIHLLHDDTLTPPSQEQETGPASATQRDTLPDTLEDALTTQAQQTQQDSPLLARVVSLETENAQLRERLNSVEGVFEALFTVLEVENNHDLAKKLAGLHH